METARRLNGIGEYYFSKKLREIEELKMQGKDIISLGIGSPDQPPHPEVIRVLKQESSKPNVHAYQSYKGSAVLREAMSKWYKRWYDVSLDPVTEILPLIGSKEGIMHLCMTYINEGDKVLVPNPGYPTYSSAVKLAGGETIYYQLEQLHKLEDFFPGQKIKILFANFPHMPTGQTATKKLFEKIIAWAVKNDVLVIHDNPYSFILTDKPMSILSVDGAKDCAVELNSLSKSHNMAGWRVGMLCGAKEKIDQVLRFKSNMDSGMFLPVQMAAAKALSLGEEWHEQVNAVYKKRRKKIFDLLDKLQCQYSTNQAGLFIWAEVNEKYRDGYEFADELLYNHGIFITPGGIFGSAGEKYIRLSLCATEEKIDEAINRIKKNN